MILFYTHILAKFIHCIILLAPMRHLFLNFVSHTCILDVMHKPFVAHQNNNVFFLSFVNLIPIAFSFPNNL